MEEAGMGGEASAVGVSGTEDPTAAVAAGQPADGDAGELAADVSRSEMREILRRLVFAFLTIAALGLSALWVAQRQSLSWPWRTLAFLIALMLGSLVALAGFDVTSSDARYRKWQPLLVALPVSIAALFVASLTPLWAHVPTSGWSRQPSTYNPSTNVYDSGRGTAPDSTNGNLPHNDSDITSPYWTQCKAELGYASLLDSQLTTTQAAEVAACVVNAGLDAARAADGGN